MPSDIWTRENFCRSESDLRIVCWIHLSDEFRRYTTASPELRLTMITRGPSTATSSVPRVYSKRSLCGALSIAGAGGTDDERARLRRNGSSEVIVWQRVRTCQTQELAPRNVARLDG